MNKFPHNIVLYAPGCIRTAGNLYTDPWECGHDCLEKTRHLLWSLPRVHLPTVSPSAQQYNSSLPEELVSEVAIMLSRSRATTLLLTSMSLHCVSPWISDNMDYVTAHVSHRHIIINTCTGVVVKAGLWTLDWTVEWNLDWNMDCTVIEHSTSYHVTIFNSHNIARIILNVLN